MDDLELKKIIETLLFITDEPLTAEKISKICDIDDVKYINIFLFLFPLPCHQDYALSYAYTH